MPLEIREVIIRANVGNPNQGASNNSQGSDHETVPKEEIIKDCVSQVIEMMKDKNER